MPNNKSHTTGETVKKLKVNNKHVQVESAICDGEGNQINETYSGSYVKSGSTTTYQNKVTFEYDEVTKTLKINTQ